MLSHHTMHKRSHTIQRTRKHIYSHVYTHAHRQTYPQYPMYIKHAHLRMYIMHIQSSAHVYYSITHRLNNQTFMHMYIRVRTKLPVRFRVIQFTCSLMGHRVNG